MTGTKEQVGTTTPTPALIDHILTSYHEAHRRDLPNLTELSQRVETVHANDPNAPHGLTEALKSFVRDLEEHMSREVSCFLRFECSAYGWIGSVSRCLAA